jgi:hypothetical protein
MPYKIICKKTQIRPPRKFDFNAVLRINRYALAAGTKSEQLLAAEILANDSLHLMRQVDIQLTEVLEILRIVNSVADAAADIEVFLAGLLAMLTGGLRRIPEWLGYFVKRFGIARLIVLLGILLQAISMFRINIKYLEIYSQKLKIALVYALNVEE